ncbi:Rv3654c family TadE-like protein [Streptomyces sp. NPDC059092]|uniref:Rv3654c family TadE-like protein n=1 Tax=Streptomyces sp. NPDC059092 TaxID=3346725 RepID=UPI0036BCDD11
MSRTSRDRGAATVWAAMAATTMCVVFAAVLALGQAVVARHRAGAAADLAALAAADRVPSGPAVACRGAADVAAAQGARVVRCVVSGEIAEVTATAQFGPYAPTVRARAGPPRSAYPPDPPSPPGPPYPDPPRLGRPGPPALP